MSGESIATKNVKDAFRTDSNFPEQVFTEGWGNFEFFDSDWMRDQDFIWAIQRLLEIEGSDVASLVNLDYRETGIEPQSIRVDLATTEWLSAVESPEPGKVGWLSGMVRIGATSAKGGWCAYCEPIDEIGVMAFRSAELHERARLVLTKFHALPIAAKIAAADCYAFSNVAATPDYFASLLASYGEH